MKSFEGKGLHVLRTCNSKRRTSRLASSTYTDQQRCSRFIGKPQADLRTRGSRQNEGNSHEQHKRRCGVWTTASCCFSAVGGSACPILSSWQSRVLLGRVKLCRSFHKTLFTHVRLFIRHFKNIYTCCDHKLSSDNFFYNVLCVVAADFP